MPQSPSSSSSSEAERDYPPLPEPLEINWPELNSQALGCGVEDRGLRDRYQCAEYGWEDGVDRAIERVPEEIYDADQMRAYVDADRAARPTPPSLPIDFKQASEQEATEKSAVVTAEMIAAGLKAANALDPVLSTLYPNELTAVYQAMHALRPFAQPAECTTCGALVVGVAPLKQASEQGGWLPKTSAPDLCYSFDQESYTSGDLNEALQSLEDKGDLTEGVVFYMAEEQRHAPSDYFDIDDMLTSMGERASEEAGEWPDDFPDVPKEKVAELQVLISSWLDANVTATFFTAHNTREVWVTDEMIAAFKSEGQAAPSPRPEEGALLLGGDEGGKKGGLIATAPELLAAIESEYAWLADIRHNWAGRDTAAGQQRLCRLRDLICKATDRDPQDVQDDYSNRSAGTQP